MVWRELTVPKLLIELRRHGARVSQTHLSNALRGRVHPNEDLRRLLPVVLGIPLEACFDPELLAAEYTGTRR